MYLWIASLFFYIFIFLFCELLRLITQKLFENDTNKRSNELVALLCYEFIGTVQLCAPMFDVNFVMENYGLSGVFLEICFIEFVNSFLLRRAHADPCSLFYNYINEHHSLRIASYLLATQFAAGIVQVATIYGSAVEAFGLLGGKMAEYFINDNLINENFITLTLSIISGLITILGINLTGMYANPIVAWALTFNCGEVF